MSEAVRFPTSGGHQLAGLYAAAPAGSPAVALCHGMLSSKASEKLARLATIFAERGIASLRFDFSGRGESGGDPRRILYSQEVEDLAAAARVLGDRGHRRLGLFGSSMGGAVTVLYAARDDRVAAVATLAAVSRPGHFLVRVPPEELARWRGQGYFVYDGVEISTEYVDDSTAVDVLGAARSLTVPLLVLHGARDAVVPVEDGRLLAAAGGGELVEFPEADHRFSRPGDLELALGRVARFLGDHLIGGAA